MQILNHFNALFLFSLWLSLPRNISSIIQLKASPLPLSDTCTLSTICCVRRISNSMMYHIKFLQFCLIPIAFPCPHTIPDPTCPHKYNFSSLQLLVHDGLIVFNLCSFVNRLHVHFDPLIHSNLCYYQYL